PGRLLLLSVGSLPTFDNKKTWLGLGSVRDAELLVLIDVRPDPSNQVAAPPAADELASEIPIAAPAVPAGPAAAGRG
ncbi:MAG: hypothetical protein ACRDD1_12570, partial [Planctomycetia bacterium]